MNWRFQYKYCKDDDLAILYFSLLYVLGIGGCYQMWHNTYNIPPDLTQKIEGVAIGALLLAFNVLLLVVLGVISDLPGAEFVADLLAKFIIIFALFTSWNAVVGIIYATYQVSSLLL
jgi:hypothetical protein